MSLIEGRCCLVAVSIATSACSVTVAGPACSIKGRFWKVDVVCAAPRIEKRKIKPVAINACFIMFFLTEVLNCGFDFNGKKRLFKPPVKAGSNHSKSRNAEYGRWSELRPNVLSGLWRRLLILN